MTEPAASDTIRDPAQVWRDYQPTPLIELPALALRANVGRVFAKLEGERPLGNFKALGGMLAGLQALARVVGARSVEELPYIPRGSLPRLVCASDGNHGLAVAAAAARAGTSAVIYLPADVSPTRARRIEAHGGTVVRIAGTYDDAVQSAIDAATRGDGLLIADTATDPDDVVVRDVMAGYAVITRELATQFRDTGWGRPTHLFVQAGVGGLAAAMADGLADLMQCPRRILTVEPRSAACVASALAAGHPVRIPGALHTSATMLSCGMASAPALEILRQHDARALIVDEDELAAAPRVLRETAGADTTASGAAGLAGLLHVAANASLREEHRLDGGSNVLLVITEGAVED